MKKTIAIVIAALTAFCAFTASAVSPCVPEGTALALYVNCGPISRNAEALKLWKSLQEESHSFQDIADGVTEVVEGFCTDAAETAEAEAWKSARFDWTVVTLGDYKFKPNKKGQLRIPPVSVTIGGLFKAEPFLTAVVGSDAEKGEISKIDDLDFTAYSVNLEDNAFANLKPCFAVPQDGLFVIGSNKKILKKTVGLYEGKVKPEPAVSKIFEKSPNGVFALYADLATLKKSDLVSAFKAVGMPQSTTNDWLTMLDLFSQIRVYVSVENAKDIRVALEYVAKGKLAEQMEQMREQFTDEHINTLYKEQIENYLNTALVAAGCEDLKLKDFQVTVKGKLVHMEAVVNAIFLAKLIDAPEEDKATDEEDDEDEE